MWAFYLPLNSSYNGRPYVRFKLMLPNDARLWFWAMLRIV